MARGCVEEMSDPECTDDAPEVLQTLNDILSTLNGNIVESKASTCTCDDEENCNSEGVTFGFDGKYDTRRLFPVNTNHLYNMYTMLDQGRRRWADVL